MRASSPPVLSIWTTRTAGSKVNAVVSVVRVFEVLTYGIPLASKDVTFRPPTLIEFEVVFPVFTTWSRVGKLEPEIGVWVRLLILPSASTTMMGDCVEEPYVPGVALVVHTNLEAFPE